MEGGLVIEKFFNDFVYPIMTVLLAFAVIYFAVRLAINDSYKDNDIYCGDQHLENTGE